MGCRIGWSSPRQQRAAATAKAPERTLTRAYTCSQYTTGGNSGSGAGARQAHIEARALSESSFHADLAAALTHDAIDGGEPESGAMLLGGEKRLEDVRQ